MSLHWSYINLDTWKKRTILTTFLNHCWCHPLLIRGFSLLSFINENEPFHLVAMLTTGSCLLGAVETRKLPFHSHSPATMHKIVWLAVVEKTVRERKTEERKRQRMANFRQDLICRISGVISCPLKFLLLYIRCRRIFGGI